MNTAGRWNPKDRNIYFIAGSPADLSLFPGLISPDSEKAEAIRDLAALGTVAGHLLVAVNEIGDKDIPVLRSMLDQGCRVLMDSGVYSLAMENAVRLGITHNEALRLPLEELRGYKELRERYVQLATAFGSQLWGYIEIDLGGRDVKRKTRAGLEQLGLRPIPVYHILNDGWDYFDELASRYDRICCGNIVQASLYVRKRILATLHQRKQRYPGLWIHCLGLTPNELLCGMPVESADSSTWLGGVRWGRQTELSLLKPVDTLPSRFKYVLGDLDTWNKAKRLGAYACHLNMANWRGYLSELRRMEGRA